MSLQQDPYMLAGESVQMRQSCFLLPAVNGIKVQCPGDLTLTNAQLIFRPSETGHILVAVPLGCIKSLKRVKGKGLEMEYVLDITCKDIRHVRLGFPNKLAYKNISNHIRSLCYEPSIQRLFAFIWKPGNWPAWHYDAQSEMERCGLHTGEHRITNLNMNYKLCDSYPSVLSVPTLASDTVISAVAKFRSRGRLPVATYKYKQSQAAMYRCSQPLVGLGGKRSGDDEHLLAVMASLPAYRGEASTLRIVDARPKAAALANKFKGAGIEIGNRYARSSLEFLSIGNIHTMRGSLQKMVEACSGAEPDTPRFYQAIDGSHWKDHINRIISGACKIADYLVVGDPVLVHCTDGWDRTAQLTCLTEMMLDPYYRTIEGFAVLVQKEWISFGHKFAQRHGHGMFASKIKDNQRAPIFLQFIDTCWQLLQQFPLAFEWNERFLLVVLDASMSNIFGTFLCNTDQERTVLYGVPQGTVSLWSYILHEREPFLNPLYDPAAAGERITPKIGANLMRYWKGLYQRYKLFSVNELEGMRNQTSETIVNINAMWDHQLEKTHAELVHARDSRAVPAATVAAVPPQQQHHTHVLSQRTSLLSPTQQVKLFGGRGSATLEELEYQQKRLSSHPVHKRGGSVDGAELAVDASDASYDLFIDISDESLQDLSSQSSTSEETASAPKLSPRVNAEKRRGLKLSQAEIISLNTINGVKHTEK